jgi:hypothetical protein
VDVVAYIIVGLMVLVAFGWAVELGAELMRRR